MLPWNLVEFCAEAATTPKANKMVKTVLKKITFISNRVKKLDEKIKPFILKAKVELFEQKGPLRCKSTFFWVKLEQTVAQLVQPF